MELLLLGVAVMVGAFMMGIKRNPAVSLLGQSILALMVLGFGAGILFCLFYPASSHGDNTGVLILGVFPLFLVGLIPWALLKNVRSIIRTRRGSSEKK